MRKAIRFLLLILLAASLFAQTAPPSTSKTTTKSKSSTTAKKKAAAPSEAQVLKKELEAQQQQIQQLRDEAQRRDAAMRQMEQQLSALQSAAQQAQSAAQSAESSSRENASALQTVQTSFAELRTTGASTSSAVQKYEKRIGDLEHPLALNYKGITITPGGFLSAVGIFRTHNTGSDTTSNFGGIPFSGTSNSHLSEFRFTARHSNLNLMAQGTVRGIKASTYVEIDFEGAAPTANETITNSFTPRIREFWGNVELKNGLSFLGGQEWELMTPNRKGIAPKGEFRPATIDASYLVGYHYARETMFRVTKKVNDQLTFAVAVENPETVTQGSGAPPSCSTGTANCIVPGVQGTGFAAVTSTDAAPDIAVKVAFDPGWGHYELGGIARFYRSRFVTTTNSPDGGTNTTNVGGAFAVNAILPLVPKKVDFYLASIAGRGVGRFLPGGGVDVIVKPDGTLMPVQGAGIMAGFETHPRPDWDINLYAGNEYYDRTIYLNATGGQVGYGRTTANQTTCSFEVPTSATACEANNRDIWEITPQIWHRFWRGKEGMLQWGLQYQYIHRRPWQGNVGTAPNPVGIENVVMTALRWYFP
jgi:hypothetical protein